MAAKLEMKALRLQNKALKAEVACLKETRAAIYKLYIESEGVENRRRVFTRAKVFEALQLSADPDRVKKEPAPNSGRKPKAKPDEVAPAEEVKVEVEPDEVKVELEVEPDNRTLEEKYQDLVDASVVAKAWRAEEMRKALEVTFAWAEYNKVKAELEDTKLTNNTLLFPFMVKANIGQIVMSNTNSFDNFLGSFYGKAVDNKMALNEQPIIELNGIPHGHYEFEITENDGEVDVNHLHIKDVTLVFSVYYCKR